MWDQRYDVDDYVYGTQPNQFLKEQVSHLPKGRVLCLAEGEGRNAVFLAELGYEVTAVDCSSVGLKKAQQLATQQGVEIETIHADLADYDLGCSKWDAIVSIFCHLPPELRVRVHQQVVKALKPGGCLLLEAYRPKQLEYGTGGPPSLAMMMSKAGLKVELEGLEFHQLQELERDVVEGSFHTGLGAVVQLIATKRP